MITFMKCVAEAVLHKGVRGLAEMVPGGVYLHDVATDAIKRLKEKRNHDQIREDVRQAAAASFEEAKKIAERVAREAAAAAANEDRLTLELYLTQIPGTARKSLRRADDPTGRTVPPALVLNTPADLLTFLSPYMPRFRAGMALPLRRGWHLVEPLGIGGFGEVWKINHNLIPDARAVKFCTDPVAKQRLLKHEKDLISRVIKECKVAHVVMLMDTELTGDYPWLSYEYVPGGDLAALILTWQQLPVAERMKRVIEAMRVLATTAGHFHALPPPIVHRDLKPANILIASDGSLKITDFGIGNFAAGNLLLASKSGATAYSRGASMLAGSYTPIYASPQQQAGGPADPRDDVHALGVIAFQMLTGRLDTGPGPRFDRDLKGIGVTDVLIDLIGDCVDPNLHQRPATGVAVAARLSPIKPIVPILPRIPTAAPKAVVPKAVAPPVVTTPGSAEEDFQRGEAHFHGLRGPQDQAAAAKWYERAAAQGHSQAQYCLGLQYENGWGVPRDCYQAHAWYAKAASQRCAEAQYALARLLENGWGAPQDESNAMTWYQQAAEQGYALAQHRIGDIYYYGLYGRKSISDAWEWYDRAATQGLADSQFMIAQMYDHGTGAPLDRSAAKRWYEKAAAQGFREAQMCLGRTFEEGIGVPVNLTKAIEWYRTAGADKDVARVENRLKRRPGRPSQS